MAGTATEGRTDSLPAPRAPARADTVGSLRRPGRVRALFEELFADKETQITSFVEAEETDSPFKVTFPAASMLLFPETGLEPGAYSDRDEMVGIYAEMVQDAVRAGAR